MMRKIPLAGLKKRLEELEAQAPELMRAMQSRQELPPALALGTLRDEELNAVEAFVRRQQQDPDALPSAEEKTALDAWRDLVQRYAACQTEEEARAVYREHCSGYITGPIDYCCRQLGRLWNSGNGHGGRQGG